MTSNYALIEICKKLRYDLTAAQGKITDIIQALEGANIAAPTPADPMETIKRLIRNRAITDTVSLNAELAAHPSLSSSDRAVLVALLGEDAA